MRMVFLLAVGLSIAGCGHYTHSVVNSGEGMLYGLAVESGESRFGHGYLQAGCHSTYMGSMRIVKNPPPVVSWKNEDRGELIRRIVALPRSQGRGSEVVFEIGADGSVKALVR